MELNALVIVSSWGVRFKSEMSDETIGRFEDENENDDDDDDDVRCVLPLLSTCACVCACCTTCNGVKAMDVSTRIAMINRDTMMFVTAACL